MCVVHTVAEYLEYLTNIKSTLSLSNTVSCNTFFRGQADATWQLSPSLYRQGLFYGRNFACLW